MPKQWDPNVVPDLIQRMYRQVLERDSDPSGLLTFGSALVRGETTVRNCVLQLGLSPEYQTRFLDPNKDVQKVELCYQHFLARHSDPGGLIANVNQVDAA